MEQRSAGARGTGPASATPPHAGWEAPASGRDHPATQLWQVMSRMEVGSEERPGERAAASHHLWRRGWQSGAAAAARVERSGMLEAARRSGKYAAGGSGRRPSCISMSTAASTEDPAHSRRCSTHSRQRVRITGVALRSSASPTHTERPRWSCLTWLGLGGKVRAGA